MQVSEFDELGIMFIISFYHCLLQSGIQCWFYNEQCKLFIVCFHTNLLNHEFLFQMPLFLFLVEVPGGGARRFRIELQWQQAGKAVGGYFYGIFAIVIMVYDLQMFFLFFHEGKYVRSSRSWIFHEGKNEPARTNNNRTKQNQNLRENSGSRT